MGGNESTAAGTEESVGRPPVMYSHSMELMETAGGAAAGGACQAPAGGTSSGRSRGTSITETMAEHFGAKKTHAFIVHLVNEDLSAVRPIVLEVHGSGLAFAHPKAPFQAFKRFALDELAGWKATDASFTFVSVTDIKKGTTQQWSIATEQAALIEEALDSVMRATVATMESDDEENNKTDEALLLDTSSV